MRLQYFLLVAVATLLVGTDVVSASADSAQTKLSTVTATDSARLLAGAVNEVNDKRSLRSERTEYEGDKDDEDGDDDESDDEERGIPVIAFYADEISTSGLIKLLRKKGAMTDDVAKQLKTSGLDKEDIARMYSKYVAIAQREK
ncbi:hypothetical protein PHYBOEH_010469 [Phytophthora boehmeriae]|uniref:RxLR effector protein n=1 Tax=Phytophthora boehmeriae TaxID=109152 RepID=A0A8T1VMU7_9STRA|nr:hypothetical protein PHYBOEH_010469 [Phytophthora boehmeriae]